MGLTAQQCWKLRNQERYKQQQREYRQRPETKAKLAANSKRWRERHLEEVQEKDRMKARARRMDKEAQCVRMARFKAKQEALLASIAGRPRAANCELCGEKAKTVFDHCHAQGHFRGWLCNRCNRTLGQVKDDIDLLMKMVRYLEHGKAHSKAAETLPPVHIRIAG